MTAVPIRFLGSQLSVDFQIVATTGEIVDKVIEKLNLDTTYESMLNRVEVTNPKGSHILQIVVRDPNPYNAADISNAFANELRYRIADAYNCSNHRIGQSARRADFQTEKNRPSGKRVYIL